MKTVKASRLGTMAMVAGGEKKFSMVVDDGELKEWVGIGWVTLRRATKNDRTKYPKVVR